MNLGSAGVIPVAILSAADFDATTEVEPDSIRLAGARVKLVGKGKRLLCSDQDVNDDGLEDLKCNIEVAELWLEEGDEIAVLEATAVDGTPLRGEDTIRMVP